MVYRSSVARADLVRSVLASLPTQANFVSFPDHPLLLRGPDVLASINGALRAYFVLSRSMHHMISDVVLSRLALPAETKYILVSDAPLPLDTDGITFFEEVMMTGVEEEEVPVGDVMRTDGAQLIETFRPFHHERFADAWASTTGRWHRKRKTPGEPSSLFGPRIGWSRRYMDFHEGEFIFSPPPQASWRSITPSLHYATISAVRADYNLGGGISGLAEVSRLAESGRAHLALHRGRLPSREQVVTFDALKPFRAAAFAGFATKGLEDFG